ncbi:DEAD/DEAH box helicase family protein [Methanomicrobium antiquum]|uniref:DEAD/DEAH box helicase family protein n=1 Tax=Methanomicrobium antiquum TaxID=487686 RepID=A0AAF0JMC0_9EURY|nr:type I restriction-modification enzyme R subunit C-terminal domain-containing protein [Methanomicrobium antiquum]WFN36987.1 DEAD/DEAH box helicase family protein [Methanomicrobium antiquum]
MITPEAKARENIDEMLNAAGWVIQDRDELNLSAGTGVAVREFPLKEGFADYLLFAGKKAVGVIEAKKEGTTLSGVSDQSQKYLTGRLDNIPNELGFLPFGYESTGKETYFRDLRDPEPRSRRVFWFHKPETLLEWMKQEKTLRARMREYPPLVKTGLRECQIEAITNLEHSFAEDHPRSLIQMATGSGKTFTAVSFAYRLIKHCNAKRILFLVDRTSLGTQTHKEFQKYVTPDDGRKFTELYNVQPLSGKNIDDVSKVCICTIQRLYSLLRGDEGYDPESDEFSSFEQGFSNGKPKDVGYNSEIPIETFDFIVTDECHRSIYNLWSQVLEYFDAHLIGLTATPSKQTLGFFNKNLVMEYGSERAVADGVNVGFDVFRIVTEITKGGSSVDADLWVEKREKLSRDKKWELLDEDFSYTEKQLDRDVVSYDQIRTVIRTFKENLFTKLFVGRSEIPKTLIFAKSDSHAEDIVEIVREEFGRGNEFCKKITYKTGRKPEDMIREFRTSYNPRIAVTVDMVSTGIDIKPLECLIFMRDVKSQVYFEQMLGRGTRTVDLTDLHQVTTDAPPKDRFIVVDAVGVCESSKNPAVVIDKKPGISFKKLLEAVAVGNHEDDLITTLATRLARLDRRISDREREEIFETANLPVKSIINSLYASVDPDEVTGHAMEMSATENPTESEIAGAKESLVSAACEPFDNPKLRTLLIDLKTKSEQILDKVSEDRVIEADFSTDAKERAVITVANFKQFIEDNKDTITALQIIYSRPKSERHLTYAQIRELSDILSRPPYGFTPDSVWKAYEQVEKNRVRGATPQRMLTDIISLVRFTLGCDKYLEPFSETVEHRYERWLREREEDGQKFSDEQIEWLNIIKDHISTSVEIGPDDFEYNQRLMQKGGLVSAYRAFGDELNSIMSEMNEVLGV